jgi:transcriptional regulator with XRE-family HTH domain
MKKTTISNELQKRMTERNLSIRDLEKLANTKPNSVRYIIEGTTEKPNVFLIQAIAKALGCTIHDLMDDGEYEDVIVKSRTENKVSRLITDLIEELKEINHLSQKEGIRIERMDLLKECLNYELDSSDSRNLNFNKIQSIALENYNKKMNTLQSEKNQHEPTSLSHTNLRIKDSA